MPYAIANAQATGAKKNNIMTENEIGAVMASNIYNMAQTLIELKPEGKELADGFVRGIGTGIVMCVTDGGSAREDNEKTLLAVMEKIKRAAWEELEYLQKQLEEGKE